MTTRAGIDLSAAAFLRLLVAGLPALAVIVLPAAAADYKISGYADFRLVYPSDTDGFLVGGLGKTRWATDHQARLRPELGTLALRADASPMPALHTVVELRYDTQQKTALDILDAFARYRPVSVTRWRWSLKAGAFFPPISLENTDIGWASPWTLTPSAINSWVGDELRIIGSEAAVEWRGDVDHLSLAGALFAWNQPAGVVMADRGWAFDDHPIGLLDHVRLPDAVAAARAPPGQPYSALYDEEFHQVDGSPGWYLTASWDRPDYGRLTALYYDNNADPAARDNNVAAWRTKFWSVGAQTQIRNLTLIAQGMTGSTAIQPPGIATITTDFTAAFVLLGWQRGNWRYALRGDAFLTSNSRSGGEHGHAVTAAISWKPYRWLRLTSELMQIDSWRPQRMLDDNGPPRVGETQLQLAAKLSF